jgi:hypothetical protein
MANSSMSMCVKSMGVAIYESEVWFGELEYDFVIREDGTLLNKRLENDGNHDGLGRRR